MERPVVLAAVVVVLTAGCAAGAGPPPSSPPEPAAAPGAEPPPEPAEPRVVRPGAPGEPTRAADPDAPRPERTERYSEADVDFMQAMMLHHAQALVMAAMAPERTERQRIRLLADRIHSTQESEIALMRRWLEERGEPVPALDDEGHAHAGAHAGHAAGADPEPTMAGMATPAELERLAASRGDAFDRLFLELMIRHHEGALTMLEVLDERGGAQDPEVHMFAGHVDADQRAEIARMRNLRNELFE